MHGVPKKHEYFLIIRKSLAISIQYHQGIILLKGDIHRFVSNIEQFLSDLKGPRNCHSKEVNFSVGHPVSIAYSNPITGLTEGIISSQRGRSLTSQRGGDFDRSLTSQRGGDFDRSLTRQRGGDFDRALTSQRGVIFYSSLTS